MGGGATALPGFLVADGKAAFDITIYVSDLRCVWGYSRTDLLPLRSGPRLAPPPPHTGRPCRKTVSEG